MNAKGCIEVEGKKDRQTDRQTEQQYDWIVAKSKVFLFLKYTVSFAGQ